MYERGIPGLQVPGWDPLMDGIKLENAWVFAKDDSIPAAVKAFLDFEKRLLEPIPKPDRIKVKLTDIPGTSLLCHIPLFNCGQPRHLRRFTVGMVPAILSLNVSGSENALLPLKASWWSMDGRSSSERARHTLQRDAWEATSWTRQLCGSWRSCPQRRR